MDDHNVKGQTDRLSIKKMHSIGGIVLSDEKGN